MTITDEGSRSKEEGVPSPREKRMRPRYGVDEPRTIIALTATGATSVAGGIAVQFFRRSLANYDAFFWLLCGLVVGFVFIGFAFALYWGSGSWKPREIAHMVSSIPWGGGELVLDVGCGRGMFTNAVGDKLTSGTVVALDLWRRKDVSGNSPASLMENAAACDNAGKVSPILADPSFLPFKQAAFDVVVSGLSLDRLVGESKAAAVDGILGSLKGGGRLAFLIAGQSLSYADLIKQRNMRDVTTSLFRLGLLPPAHSILARKPYEQPKQPR